MRQQYCVPKHAKCAVEPHKWTGYARWVIAPRCISSKIGWDVCLPVSWLHSWVAFRILSNNRACARWVIAPGCISSDQLVLFSRLLIPDFRQYCVEGHACSVRTDDMRLYNSLEMMLSCNPYCVLFQFAIFAHTSMYSARQWNCEF